MKDGFVARTPIFWRKRLLNACIE